MKKTNFIERFNAINLIVQEATKFIETAPIKSGQTIKLMKKGDDINDVPMASRVDKHGCYDEFGVVAISKPNQKLFPTEVILHLEGKGEVSDEKKEVPLSEIGNYYVIDDYNICALADLVSKTLK